MKTTIEILNSSGELSSEILDEFKKGIRKISVKKGETIQRKGERSINSYFVLKGLLKSYSIDENGKEHIFMFAPEKWVIGGIDAQAENSHSQLFIEAIEDSIIEVISNNSLELFKQFPQPILYREFERLLRRTSVLQKRIIMLMSCSAKERYIEFLNTYPDIVQRVPQKLIASYLGITPQALSTIRKSNSKSKN